MKLEAQHVLVEALNRVADKRLRQGGRLTARAGHAGTLAMRVRQGAFRVSTPLPKSPTPSTKPLEARGFYLRRIRGHSSAAVLWKEVKIG